MKSTVYYIPIRFLLDLDDKLIHIWIRKTEKPNLNCTGTIPSKKNPKF